jgi:hypothetical protein
MTAPRGTRSRCGSRTDGHGVVAPALSLSYSSSAGNGLAGVGWSLGGLSSISWCPTTIAQDGQTDGATDHVRLVAGQQRIRDARPGQRPGFPRETVRYAACWTTTCTRRASPARSWIHTAETWSPSDPLRRGLHRSTWATRTRRWPGSATSAPCLAPWSAIWHCPDPGAPPPERYQYKAARAASIEFAFYYHLINRSQAMADDDTSSAGLNFIGEHARRTIRPRARAGRPSRDDHHRN